MAICKFGRRASESGLVREKLSINVTGAGLYAGTKLVIGCETCELTGIAPGGGIDRGGIEACFASGTALVGLAESSKGDATATSSLISGASDCLTSAETLLGVACGV